MSRATDWPCRPCGCILGRVRNGVLRPLLAVESVDGTPGVLTLTATAFEDRITWQPPSAASVRPAPALTGCAAVGTLPVIDGGDPVM